MGQNSSRQLQQPTTSSLGSSSSNNVDNGPIATPTARALASNSNATPQAGPSRRQSVRRSILNLVKPSIRSPVDGTVNNSRKSWRHSRRWSKAPLDSIQTADAQIAESSTAPPSPVSEKGKEVDRGLDTLSTEPPIEARDRPLTPIQSTSTDVLSDTLESATRLDQEPIQHFDTMPNTVDVLHDDAPEELETQDEVVIRPDPIIDSTPEYETNTTIEETAEQDLHANHHTPPTQQIPNHQFPPPGTLVVVQGVVHTTDVPRPSAPSNQLQLANSNSQASLAPPTPSNENARNRLSALLRSRPASMIASRPVSTIDPLSTPNNNTSTTLDATSTADRLAADTTAESRAASHTDLASDTSPAPADSPSTDPQSGTISSSSIDVLGTLLSVAAAATAASLLTGTSEPILSSSLGPPSYNSPSTAPASHAPFSDAWASRPTSPTPTAGLGIDTSAAGRAERLRHAWGSIRERLGLRPAPNSTSTSPLDTNPLNADALPAPPSNDPRELVLAQMARAFNLGLGLAGEASVEREREELDARDPLSESGTGINEGENSQQLPAEGSFERFLVDLQTDLRVALLTSNAITVGPSIEPPPAITSETTENTHGVYTASAADSPESGDVSDTDSEFEDAHETAIEDETILSAIPPNPHPSQPHPETLPASNSDAPNVHNHIGTTGGITEGSVPETDAQGRINWWRLYRFPPIITPRSPGAANAAPGPNTPLPFGFSSPDLDSPPLGMNTQHSDPSLANSAADASLPTPLRTHTVVPVIVVGLQSVSANWQHPAVEDDEDGEILGDGQDAGDDEFNADGTPNMNSRSNGQDPGRRHRAGRGWHSRAAEAFRNLRPGRRPRTTPVASLPGSRTFLIYVIGGYYPPDHSIVTGGPNSLDSFEALLELAELLGQVKPPTVTKEDIEKSGLETIKSSQLEQYEKDEKISSNCTERCLICLDDYQPEEDIRVMTCRHAFHKTCVDKWLETGRNNCPACRSKGVQEL